MAFADNLRSLPSVAHLLALELVDAQNHTVARIENKPGQTGSLTVYTALATKHGSINAAAAAEGLALYAEHTEDAKNHPGKHPNIDRLLALLNSGTTLTIVTRLA
jgi:hypothetical protein